MGTKLLWDPPSQSVMSRKDSKGNAGGSQGPRVQGTEEVFLGLLLYTWNFAHCHSYQVFSEHKQ